MTLSFDNRFDALSALIQTARDKTLAGQHVVLSSLEKDVAFLCRNVMNSGPEVAHSYKMRISDIISQLDELVADIEHYKDNLTRS